ncbi:MAG TPA: NAD(P)/FAD-dependent oxidoreductase [Chloroflexota bacterium]|nr:NAD(P)/FAD-dependent oxidoreductase [Chloroflexota bacterium]
MTTAKYEMHQDRQALGSTRKRPRVVILGAGFGGVSAATQLARALRRGAPLHVTLVDRNNYHAFAPLLYQAAVGLVDTRSVAYPVRALTSGLGIDFLKAQIESIDVVGRQVHTSEGDLAYDWLITALGSMPRYFGLRDPYQRVLPLKSIQDASRIRARIMSSFEEAERLADPEQRKYALSFTIVGGGATGLELAGALRALIKDVAGREYRNFRDSDASVTVLEAGNEVLPGFEQELTSLAHQRLVRQGVTIRLGQRVQSVDERAVITVEGVRYPSSVVVWAAGVQPSSTVEALPGERARDGRIVVRPTLQVSGDHHTFLIGDMAAFFPPGASRPLGALAPVAIQEGATAARNLLRAVAGRPMRPFHYRDRGSLVILGRYAAVAQVSGSVFDGLLAWLLWRAVHLAWLRGLRHKLEVLVDWSLLTLTPRQTSIVESAEDTQPAEGRIREATTG